MDAGIGWRLEVGYCSDSGRQRELNEDSYLALTPPAAEPGAAILMAVADGVGGHQAGEVASSLVVAGLESWFASGDYRQRVAYSPQREDYFLVVLKEVLEAINDDLCAWAMRSGQTGMGSTATVALVRNRDLFIGHVGDSRAYLLRDGRLFQLTQDHSWVAEEVLAGRMRPDEAASHPRRNVLTRALGQGPAVRVDRERSELCAGDLVLLCSDGASGVVSEDMMGQIMDRSASVQEGCERLVALANQQGGPDNVTVVAARFVAGEPSSDLAGGRTAGPATRRQPAAGVEGKAAHAPKPVRASKRSPRRAVFISATWLGLAVGLLSVVLAAWSLETQWEQLTAWTALTLMGVVGFGLGILVGWIMRSRMYRV